MPDEFRYHRIKNTDHICDQDRRLKKLTAKFQNLTETFMQVITGMFPVLFLNS